MKPFIQGHNYRPWRPCNAGDWRTQGTSVVSACNLGPFCKCLLFGGIHHRSFGPILFACKLYQSNEECLLDTTFWECCDRRGHSPICRAVVEYSNTKIVFEFWWHYSNTSNCSNIAKNCAYLRPVPLSHSIQQCTRLNCVPFSTDIACITCVRFVTCNEFDFTQLKQLAQLW